MEDGKLKVINESQNVTAEEVEQIQKVVDEAFNPKPKQGNPIAEKLTLEDGELDVRELPDKDFKQLIARMLKNMTDGFNILIDSTNYNTLVQLESKSPSKKAEVLRRIDKVSVRNQKVQ